MSPSERVGDGRSVGGSCRKGSNVLLNHQCLKPRPVLMVGSLWTLTYLPTCHVTVSGILQRVYLENGYFTASLSLSVSLYVWTAFKAYCREGEGCVAADAELTLTCKRDLFVFVRMKLGAGEQFPQVSPFLSGGSLHHG